MRKIRIGIKEEDGVFTAFYYRRTSRDDVRRPKLKKFSDHYKKIATEEKCADFVIQNLPPPPPIERILKGQLGADETVFTELKAVFGRMPNHLGDLQPEMSAVRAYRRATTRRDHDEINMKRVTRSNRRMDWLSSTMTAGIMGIPINHRNASKGLYIFRYSPVSGDKRRVNLQTEMAVDGTLIVRNNHPRLESIMAAIPRTSKGELHKTKHRIAVRECSPGIDRNTVSVPRGYASWMMRETRAECGWIESKVASVEGFQLLTNPDLTESKIAYAVGFDGRFLWMYVIRVEEVDGKFVAVAARLLKHNPVESIYRKYLYNECEAKRHKDDIHKEAVP